MNESCYLRGGPNVRFPTFIVQFSLGWHEAGPLKNEHWTMNDEHYFIASSAAAVMRSTVGSWIFSIGGE
jgi:hypothetical protein